jgi:transposase
VFQRIPVKEFEKQYKNHLSNYQKWDQKKHAEKWLVFPQNIGSHLSIDETAITKGELYTILTNKHAKGGKGSLVGMVEGVKAMDIASILGNIPLKEREKVREVTCDLSNAMILIIRTAFPNATVVADRFHVQQLVTEALQQLRIKAKWKAIEEENNAVKKAKQEKKIYTPKMYENGDTKKQLLSRSRYLLFKPNSTWTERQKERATILFKEFPQIEKGYTLSMMFRSFYEHAKTREEGKKRLDAWYEKVEEYGFKDFITATENLKTREDIILNYFIARSTNASAESFNAKLKGFRALVRGVRDKAFFLFRVATIYGY